jgi:hypothetical protein
MEQYAVVLCLLAVSINVLAVDIEQQLYIKASNPDISDFFGNAMTIDGDTLVIAAPNEGSSATGLDGNQGDNSAPQAGAVYILERENGTWVQKHYLKASNTGGGDVFGNPGDKFGQSVSLQGNTLVVGAPEERSGARGVNGNQGDDSIINAGAAYVFVRNGNSWSQQAYLKASNTPQVFPNFNTFYFGQAVAIDGDTIAVSSPAEDSISFGVNGSQSYDVAEAFRQNTNTGAVYIFVRNGSTWTQQAYLKPSNPTPGGIVGNPNTGFFVDGDNFGGILDLSGDTLVVGVPNESSAAQGINGNQEDEEAPFSGAVYVFHRNGNSWSQQAYIKASNSGRADWFGSSVSIQGDRLAVGAPRESSGAKGINGDQQNNTVGRAGAVYLFERKGGVWAQEAYIKSSNTGFSDQFGFSVDLHGEYLVVGANGESGGSTGVGGEQSDDSKTGAGAVYLFRKEPGGWSQQAYIKASNPDNGDAFGDQVLIDGEIMVVSATREDSGKAGIGAEQADNSVLSTGATYVFSLDESANQVSINAGLNDAWVNSAAPLQGIFITVYPVLKIVFLAWFTFDSVSPDGSNTAAFASADQRWVTALGFYDDNRVEMSAELTSGGSFNASEPLPEQDTGYGTINLEFTDCNHANLEFNFPSAGESGSFSIQRTLDSNVALCEALNAD